MINLLRTDANPRIRERAAWALDNLCDIRAKSALLEALNDPEWVVRSNAGWALVHLGSVVANDVRNIIEKNPNPNVQEMARLILEFLAMSPENSTDNQLSEKWLTWFRKQL